MPPLFVSLPDKTNTVSVVTQDTKGAKKAVLEYEVMGTAGDFSLVKINLHTGRSHQIRVQFSSIGHPLYGDQRYGAKVNKIGEQIALWSYEITCTHPTLKNQVTFTGFPKKEHPWSKFSHWFQS